MSATSDMRARYRDALPQLADVPFLTDGGIETTLIFHDGLELPHFAAYDLLTRDGGRTRCDATSSRTSGIARDAGRHRARDRRPGARTPTGPSASGHSPASSPS